MILAAAAPNNCAIMKNGISVGEIPEKLAVRERAMVIAGLAKLVDAVNH